MTAQKTKHQSRATAYLGKGFTRPRPEHDLHRKLSPHEDELATNVHYEQPAEFFYGLTGGEWNVYSCNLWPDGITTDTASQEAKLDRMAQIMGLKPGQRLLDVGCGWSGPLVYFHQKYGVQGVGLTLSPKQKQAAEARIESYGADVCVELCHWKDYEPKESFDAVFTDEVIVHFSDLGGFFSKVHRLLKPGGILLNKELHFTSSRHRAMTRAGVFIHEIYGFSGNYRTLAEELQLLDKHGFEVVLHEQIPNWNYLRTFDHWIGNMIERKRVLQQLVGAHYWERFCIYLRLARRLLGTTKMTLDAVAARALPLRREPTCRA